MPDKVWFVYLLQCRTGRIYTGVTPDVAKRIAAHRSGKGAAFTRINPPERLIAIKPFPGKREALRMESQVKRIPRSLKLSLASRWLEEHPIDQLAEKLFPTV